MRILIADDQPKVRFALRVALEQQPGSKIVSEAADTTDLLTQTQAACPDLLLMDWDLPEMPAPLVLSTLHRQCDRTIVIILSEKPEMCQLALSAGADAFVSKGDPPEYLLRAIAACVQRSQAKHTSGDPVSPVSIQRK